MLKKFYALLIGALLISCSVAPAFAGDGGGITPIKEKMVVVNEYTMAKELALNSDVELSDMGFDSEEIVEVRDYHNKFVKHIKQLQKLDDSALAKHGYTPEQIEVLKNFDESETHAVILSANLSLNATTANFRYPDNGLTKGRLAYSWEWTGVPAFKMQDAIAAAWNNWIVESETSWVNYHNINTGNFYSGNSATYTTEGYYWEGAGHKFNVSIADNLYYAKKGGGNFDVKSDGFFKKNFYYQIKYGHQRMWPTISFSIGAGGLSGSVSFNTGTLDASVKEGRYEF